MISIAESHRGRLGCSEIAAALGASPWKTPYRLWEEKTGRVEPEDLSGDLKIELGNRLEPIVAELYTEKTGLAVAPEDEEFSARLGSTGPGGVGLVGHIDRRVLTGSTERRGLEIKTSLGRFLSHEWGEEGTDQIPPHYIAQCLGYLMLTGWEAWDVAALLSGPEIRIYRIMPDAELFGAIEEGVLRFWRHVETDEPPDCITLADAARRWPHSTGETLAANAALELEVENLRRVRGEIARLEREAETCELMIKSGIGPHAALEGPDGRRLCTWAEETRKRLDGKALALAHPAIAARFTIEETRRTFRLKDRK